MRAQDVVWGRDLVLWVQGSQPGPGLTCACGSCGSEREEDTEHQTSAPTGSWGGYKHPEDLPAPLWPCLGEPRGPQGGFFTMRKV